MFSMSIMVLNPHGGPRYHLQGIAEVLGTNSRDNWGNYAKDIDKLRGHKRVWLLFSHIYTGGSVDEEQLFLYLLEGTGKRLDYFKSAGAAVYLYNLDESRALTQSQRVRESGF
jgi:hypothetical protein